MVAMPRCYQRVTSVASAPAGRDHANVALVVLDRLDDLPAGEPGDPLLPVRPLAEADLEAPPATRPEPVGRLLDEPADDREPQAAAVEGHPGLVLGDLCGHLPHPRRGDVGRVADQHVDTAPEVGGQRVEEVTV